MCEKKERKGKEKGGMNVMEMYDGTLQYSNIVNDQILLDTCNYIRTVTGSYFVIYFTFSVIANFILLLKVP